LREIVLSMHQRAWAIDLEMNQKLGRDPTSSQVGTKDSKTCTLLGSRITLCGELLYGPGSSIYVMCKRFIDI
jgi:hypothetical protein